MAPDQLESILSIQLLESGSSNKTTLEVIPFFLLKKV